VEIDSAIISDPLRVPITAQRKSDGCVIIRGHRSNTLILSESELSRLISFTRDEPRLGKLQRYPVMAPESPHSDK